MTRDEFIEMLKSIVLALIVVTAYYLIKALLGFNVDYGHYAQTAIIVMLFDVVYTAVRQSKK